MDLKKQRTVLIAETKKKLKESVTDDLLIIQCVGCIESLTKVVNMVVKTVREWYEYHHTEYSRQHHDHEEFISGIISGGDGAVKTEMGTQFSKEDFAPVLALAQQAQSLYTTKRKEEEYLEKKMTAICPNITAVAGYLIGAKLLERAGSLRKLMAMPASTVQLLGAEEALFRHLTRGAKCPKYGVLHGHPLVVKAKRTERGKAARILASKISLAAKVDYAKGEFIGDKLLKEVEGKLS